MEIRIISDPDEKQRVARAVLEALPDWFAVESSRERYIRASRGMTLIAALEGSRPIGFLCLKETGRDTAEISVMGVLREHHRKGVGRRLVERAKEAAAGQGYSFLQVKTVRMGVYDEYDDTNRFYRSLGFREFEVFPLLWDEKNPCQVYVMALK